MKRKMFKFFILSAVLLLCACSAGPPDRTDVVEAADARDVRISVIVDNLGDMSYNDGIIHELQRAEKDFQSTDAISSLSVSVYSMNTGMDDEKIEIDLAFREDSELIIIAYQIALPILEPAAAYHPGKKFILIDAEATGNNIYSAIFKPNEAAYLCGFLASEMSQTGIIGIVIGMEIPALYDFCVGYIYGALASNPDCKVIVSTVGNFYDSEAGYRLAAEQFAGGADICFGAAGGAGLGCIQAAKDFGKLSIGVDVDQSEYVDDDLKGVILTSCMKNFSTLTGVVLEEYLAGTLDFGTSGRFGLREGAVGIARNQYYRSLAGQDLQERVDRQEQLVRDGSIHVRSAYEMTQQEIEQLIGSVKPEIHIAAPPPEMNPNRKDVPIEMNIAALTAYLESESFETPAGFDRKSDDVGYGTITEIEYYSTTTETMRKCNVYTPPGFDYKTDVSYPVLYLMHGIGGTHNEWNSGRPNEIISNLIAAGQAEPLIVVIPNIRARQNDTDLSDMYGPDNIMAFDNFINDLRDNLMPYINEHYPVSGLRENTMIAGLSMGGREALFIGASMPETFSFVGAFCPAPGLISANMGIEGQMKPEELTVPAQYADSMFFFINTGNEDGVVGGNPKLYYETLINNGAAGFFYSTGGGHDFTVWKHGLYFFIKSIFYGNTP